MTQDLIFNIGGFALCALIIFLAGKKLAFYGDLLAEVTGMGRAWIGLILMAAVTSLPELMVGISSTAYIGSADLAVGDILGSCAFNLGLLSLMDIFTPKDHPLLSTVSRSNILAASFGIILLSMTGLGLFLEKEFVVLPSIGFTSLSFVLIYIFSVRTIYRYQKTHKDEMTVQEEKVVPFSKTRVIGMYILYAGIIIVTALALPHFAEGIANQTGLGKSFVGTLFLAVSTSLPEIAVSIAAIRLGLGEMAVGNLLGSNIFNIFILFIDDVFYRKGILLKDASDVHLISVFAVILMSVVVIIGFIFPFHRKRIIMGWDTLAILIIYILNIILLYKTMS
jgi:cation:H+ antiporter